MSGSELGSDGQGAPGVSVPGSLARFARAHLRTPAQHAVYRAVGSDPDSWWTGGEIATHSGLDRAEVDQALRGFAAAGILHERAYQSGGRRYRWHDELRYVFDGTAPPSERIDPVCGMPVDPDTAYAARDTTGATVYFCSRWCRAAHRSRRHRR